MSEMNEHEYMQSGLEALNSGDYNSAQVFFKQAIRVNNTNEDAWLSLAKTYSTEPDKAIKCYENVLKINPLNAEAQRMLDRLNPPADFSGASGAAAAAAFDATNGPTTPKERKPLGGPNVSVPKGVEGTPETVNLDYLVDFFQRAFKGSMALVTGQGDGSTELATSWWNALLLVISTGLATGLITAIGRLNYGSILGIFTIPFVVALLLVVAVGAGSFLSYWYLKIYRDGSASLLDHTMSFVRVWFPASLVLAIVLLIEGLSNSAVIDLRTLLYNFSFNANGLSLVLLIVTIVVTGYSAYLLQKAWARLYPTAGSGLWIAVAIALVTTGFII